MVWAGRRTVGRHDLPCCPVALARRGRHPRPADPLVGPGGGGPAGGHRRGRRAGARRRGRTGRGPPGPRCGPRRPGAPTRSPPSRPAPTPCRRPSAGAGDRPSPRPTGGPRSTTPPMPWWRPWPPPAGPRWPPTRRCRPPALVASLATSGGGAPKERVPRPTVTEAGLVGDVQADRLDHGRPWQAVSLWSAEVIDALAAEGHPVTPGILRREPPGLGIDWSRLHPGVRLHVGAEVVVEVAGPADPCRTIAASFVDGRFDRIDHAKHPGWARLYAWVRSRGRRPGRRPGHRVLTATDRPTGSSPPAAAPPRASAASPSPASPSCRVPPRLRARGSADGSGSAGHRRPRPPPPRSGVGGPARRGARRRARPGTRPRPPPAARRSRPGAGPP